MAQRTQIILTDDIDGGEADETLTFAFEGVTYEIDLSTKNSDKLRKVLSPFIDHGRRARGQAGRGKAKATRTAGSGDEIAKIRAWARDNGYEVNDRGRVPASIREAYDKAH